MKKLGLLSLAITALIGLSESAQAGSRDRSRRYYYPSDHTYESLGRNPTVRQVQLALQEEGYYVGDDSGNFGYETRRAVRRYKRDRGLPIIGKIDKALLRSLGFR